MATSENQLHPDDVRSWCHWVTCAECTAKYVCEGKRCKAEDAHLCGCSLDHDVLYPECADDDFGYED